MRDDRPAEYDQKLNGCDSELVDCIDFNDTRKLTNVQNAWGRNSRLQLTGTAYNDMRGEAESSSLCVSTSCVRPRFD